MKNRSAIFLLLLANSISGVAQGIAMLAIPWYFTGVIHRAGLFGKVYLLITGISLLWGLYAGTLIDRYDRKRIFLVINICGFIVLSSVTIIGFYSGGLHWFWVVSVFAATAFIYNIHFPNLYAFAQEITPKEDYSRVTSLLEIQGQLTFTIAGGLAAILLKGVDQHLNFFGFDIVLPFTIHAWKIYEIFSLGVVTYSVAFIIIYRIQSLPMIEKHIDLSGLAERMKVGFGFLKKHPLIFIFGNASLLIFLTVIVFGTLVQPVYVDSFLHQSGDVYAFGDMAFSFGALIAGFLTTRVFGDKSVVRGVIVLSAFSGMMYAILTFNTILFFFFAAQFIIGACNAAIRIQRITYLFHHIPNRVIGRAGSIFFVLNVFLRMCLIGLFTVPFFHHGINVVYSVGLMAAICFSATVILIVNYKRLEKQPITG